MTEQEYRYEAFRLRQEADKMEGLAEALAEGLEINERWATLFLTRRWWWPSGLTLREHKATGSPMMLEVLRLCKERGIDAAHFGWGRVDGLALRLANVRDSAVWKWSGLEYRGGGSAPSVLRGEQLSLGLLAVCCALGGIERLPHLGMWMSPSSLAGCPRPPRGHWNGQAVDVVDEEVGAKLIHTMMGVGVEGEFISMRDGMYRRYRSGSVYYTAVGPMAGFRGHHWHIGVPKAGVEVWQVVPLHHEVS